MQPTVSLIIPVYNTEPFLRQCLQSAAEQTLPNIEVIIVNNNTPDNSAVIIDEFVKKYPHFKTTLLVGGGLGGARNEGMRHATGTYVAFLDSDDWLAPTALEKLYKAAQQNNADIVVCSSYRTDLAGKVICVGDETAAERPFVRTQATALELLKIGGKMACAWRKIIRRDIFIKHNLWFPENVSAEDVACICACFALARNYAQINEPLYYYRNRPGSLSNTNAQQAPLFLFDNFAAVRPVLKQAGIYEQISEEFEFRLLSMLIGGEGDGNGGYKKLLPVNRRKLFKKSREFYLALADGFFAKRSFVFRCKWAVFRTALKYNLPSLPLWMRGPLHAVFYLSRP